MEPLIFNEKTAFDQETTGAPIPLRGCDEVCGSDRRAGNPAGIYFHEFPTQEAGRAIRVIGISSI